ncbi:sulfotransferase family protein [Serinicoccus sediminis]|uniref:sulfotransferase family protein n=1 Tax=Serinicoccus sediminis TaxID=2306021 RepID=UPI00102258AA|nr:sulfotransferase [Serinicoccus sediminis]
MDTVQLTALKARVPRWALDTVNSLSRWGALATAPDRPMPDFLVIGAKRGGTTSLFNYLVRHPGILAMYPQVRGKKSTDYYFADRGHSSAWYRSHFHTETYRRLLRARLGYRPQSFEASPYYVWDPRIPAKVAAAAPETRAILLVRDPVLRAWSHYQERVQNGVEPLSFEEALAAEDDRLGGELAKMMADPTYHSTTWDWYGYRSRGEYLAQITTWLEHFPREQLLVLPSERLYSDTQETFDRICEFLGLPAHRLPTTKPYNATWRTKDAPPKEAAAQLADHYRSHNAALADFLGERLDWT